MNRRQVYVKSEGLNSVCFADEKNYERTTKEAP